MHTYVALKWPKLTAKFISCPKTRGPWVTSFTWEKDPINNTFPQIYIIIPLSCLREKEKKNYLPQENWMFLICKNLGSISPRMLCGKFGWNWLSASGDQRRWKWEKFTKRWTDGQMKGDQESSLELSAQVS